MKLTRPLSGVVASLFCLFGASSVSAQTLPNGIYDTTDFGAIEIGCVSSGLCFGTYENGQSYLYLTSPDHSQNFTGYWVENESSRPCPVSHQSPNMQSDAWGNVNVTFDLLANELSGFWGYCEDHPNKTLDGERAQTQALQGDPNFDVPSISRFLLGSWLPAPGSDVRRNDMYTFNPDGTFVISDGSSNSPMGVWVLNGDGNMIMDGRVSEAVTIEIVGQDIMMSGDQFTQKAFNGQSYNGQAMFGDVRTEGVFQPKWPRDGTTPMVGNYELSYIIFGPSEDFRPGTADAARGPIYIEFWDVTEPAKTDADGREMREDMVGFRATEYQISSDAVSFHGYHPHWGDIYFDGRFESERVHTQYQYERMGGAAAGLDKPARADEPLILGDLLVKGHIFRDVALYIGWFD